MVIFYHEKREVIGCFQLLLLFFSWADYLTAPGDVYVISFADVRLISEKMFVRD